MLSIAEVCRMLGVSRQWLHKHKNELPERYRFAYSVRYREDEIRAYIESRRVKSGVGVAK